MVTLDNWVSLGDCLISMVESMVELVMLRFLALCVAIITPVWSKYEFFTDSDV